MDHLLPKAIARFVMPEVLPSQIEEEYANNEQFRLEMDEAEKKYKASCQRALYSNLDSIPDKLLVHAGGDDYGHTVLLYSAVLAPADVQEEKLYLYLVKRFESLLMSKYLAVVA